jgi:hypothetical protein
MVVAAKEHATLEQTVYDREGDDLHARGLYLDVPLWQASVFSLTQRDQGRQWLTWSRKEVHDSHLLPPPSRLAVCRQNRLPHWRNGTRKPGASTMPAGRAKRSGKRRASLPTPNPGPDQWQPRHRPLQHQ